MLEVGGPINATDYIDQQPGAQFSQAVKSEESGQLESNGLIMLMD